MWCYRKSWYLGTLCVCVWCVCVCVCVCTCERERERERERAYLQLHQENSFKKKWLAQEGDAPLSDVESQGWFSCIRKQFTSCCIWEGVFSNSPWYSPEQQQQEVELVFYCQFGRQSYWNYRVNDHMIQKFGILFFFFKEGRIWLCQFSILIQKFGWATLYHEKKTQKSTPKPKTNCIYPWHKLCRNYTMVFNFK
jgi:hypothetical protein